MIWWISHNILVQPIKIPLLAVCQFLAIFKSYLACVVNELHKGPYEQITILGIQRQPSVSHTRPTYRVCIVYTHLMGQHTFSYCKLCCVGPIQAINTVSSHHTTLLLGNRSKPVEGTFRKQAALGHQ